MDMAESSLKECNPSSHIITHVCLLKNCDEKLLCPECYGTHNGFQVAHVKPLNDILDFNSKRRIDEIKDMIGRASRCQEKVHNQFQLIAEKAKKDINMLIDNIMVSPYKNKNQEKVKPYKDLETLSNQLEDAKTNFINIEDQKSLVAKQILGNYVKVYHDFHRNIDDTMQGVQEKQIKSLTYKELESQIDTLLKAVEESLLSFHRAYFNQPEPQKNSMDNIVIDNDLNLDLDINELKNELTLELLAPISWNSIEYLSRSNLIITGDIEGNIKLWEPTAWKCLTTQAHHSLAINTIKHHLKSDRFFSASDDTTIKVSKINTLPIIDTVTVLREHKEKVWSLYIVEEQDILYSSGSEPCVIGWDLNTLTVKHKLNTHGKGMTGTEMAFIPRLKLLAVSFKDGVINLYNIDTPSGEVRSIKVLQKWLHCMSYIESRDEFVVGTDIGTIKVWKVGDYAFEPVRQHTIPGGLPTSMMSINNGDSLLVASGSDNLTNLDLNSGEYESLDAVENENIKVIKFISQIRKLFAGSDKNELLVCDF